MGFVVLLTSLRFDPSVAAAGYGIAGASAGFATDMPPIALAGGLFFLPADFIRALFYCARVVCLVLASLAVAYSTPAMQLCAAFAWFLSPLRRLRVPVDDIAFAFTLALRFIPLAFEELQQVKRAQMARGAAFQVGGLLQRMRAWQPVLVPWLVDLYRRAARMAVAMDVRAYGLKGAGFRRSMLDPLRLRAVDGILLAVGLLGCIAPCLLLQ
jgi:energy-coupling factor transport system permease protein